MSKRPAFPFDADKLDNIHQVGGIRTALLAPDFGGGVTGGTRVALVDTGSGLRFTVALDRGGDLVDAAFNQHGLAYLSPNGLRPPSHAYNQGFAWLRNWAGGLLTTCGPQHMGHPRQEDGQEVSLHGRYSNLPAQVEMILNPDPQRGKREMLLALTIRDSQTFGPVFEIRRQIQCILGEPVIHLYDQVTNRGNTPAAHNWLYHVNLGYPLLDEGAQFLYRGAAQYWELPSTGEALQPASAALLKQLKTVPGIVPLHTTVGERGAIVHIPGDRAGVAHAALVNKQLQLGVELAYPAEAMPRLANWQRYGRGCYVSGLEPFSGSLMGKAKDTHPQAGQQLQPGETRRYELTIRVHHGAKALAGLRKYDGAVKPLR